MVAISERWMPARTPMVPATMRTPIMMTIEPKMALSRPPPEFDEVVHSTDHFQWGTARATTPRSTQAAGSSTRRRAR